MRILINIISFIILLHSSYSLFEDQAGKFDWRQQYVGEVTHLQYDPYGQTGKRITVATKKNVLASLNIKSGEIGWRQIFEDGKFGHIDDILQYSNNIIAVLDGGSFVRSFSATVGNLQWEATGTSTHTEPAKLSLLHEPSDQVVILASGFVTARRLDNGQEQWNVELPQSSTVVYRWLYVKDSSIYVAGLGDQNRLVVVHITDDGEKSDPIKISAPFLQDETQCIVVSEFLCCLDAQKSTMYTVSLISAKKFKSSVLSSIKWSGSQQLQLTTLQSYSRIEQSMAMLRVADDHQVLLVLDKDGVVTVKKDLLKINAVQSVQVGDHSVLFTVTRKDSETIELNSFDLDSGKEISDLSGTISYPDNHGAITNLNGLVYRKRDGADGIRFIIRNQDQSIALLQLPGKVLWYREESLSSVLAVEMLDLPVSDIQAQMQDEFGSQKDDILSMFINRFTTQFHQLQDYIIILQQKLLTPRTSGYYESGDDLMMEKDKDYMTRDEFNLHKMVVVVTAAGKLFGIDSITGSPFWRVYLPGFEPFTTMQKQIAPLYIQRTTSHFPSLPQCVVLGKHKYTGNSLSYTFNPITGLSIDPDRPGAMEYDYKILQVTLASQMDKHFIKPLVVLDTAKKVHIYPNTDKSTVSEIIDSLYLYTSDSENSILNGYQIVAKGHEFVIRSLWTINLNKESSTITNIVPKRSIEHVHSQGIVLADRSVMYKYLNPNLLVVTTEGEDNNKKRFFNLYLIDAVSGHIVFHCNHRRAQGPVKIVHSENWVVYMYWNERVRRTEISGIEMYEGRNQGNATAFSSLYPPNAPIIMRQAYIFNNYASTMAATITEKGITTKHIMVALEGGGILELPKAFVDPRRPVPIDGKLDNSYREEGIMPYIPELPYSYEAIVNYNHSVYNIHGIHTAPAGLESTCLVLCYGLDLFFTRVMPSKMFDVLKDDFDYFFIMSVLFAMIGVSIVSRKLAAMKAMKRAWR